MVFPSRVALKKLASLPAKYGNKEYYKGTGGTKEGWVTSKGKFIRDITRLQFIMSPGNLQGFPLKPYVMPRKRIEGDMAEVVRLQKKQSKLPWWKRADIAKGEDKN